MFRRRGKINTQVDLRDAEESLARAEEAHADQARKREQEQEAVIQRFDRLVEDNHLAELALHAFRERYQK